MSAPHTTEAKRDSIGWRFLRSGRWFGYLVMLIIFAIACVFLSRWQFDRRDQALAEIARIDRNYDSPAVPLADEFTSLSSYDEDEQKWRTVTATGRYEGEPFFARNRPGPQGSGSDVIQAFRTDEGTVFFVDRGWVPVDGNDVTRDDFDVTSIPQAPRGTVTLEARLRASEPSIPGRDSDGRTVASIEIPELARLAGTEGDTYTGAYGMLVNEDPGSEHGVLPSKPARDEGPHLSYAVQWVLFILVAVVGVIYAGRREFRLLNADRDDVVEYERKSAERKRRRGPSDADEEDALLDA